MIIGLLTSPKDFAMYLLWYWLFITIVCPYVKVIPYIEYFYVCEVLDLPYEVIAQMTTAIGIQI